LEASRVRDEKVVAHELDFFAEAGVHFGESGVVVFVVGVFDRGDRVFFDEVFVKIHEVGRSEFFAVDLVVFSVEKFVRGGVDCQFNLVAGAVVCFFDGLQDQVKNFRGFCDPGGESALVADGGGEIFAGEDFFQILEDFGAGTEIFGEISEVRENHEFLNRESGVCVRAPVQNVDHRARERDFSAKNFAEMFEKFDFFLRGGEAGCGEGNSENCVCAEVFFVFGSVEFEHFFVDFSLVGGIEFSANFGGEDFVRVFDRAENAFSAESGRVAIAEFECLVRAGGCTGGDFCEDGFFAVGHFDFDGGVATGVEDFAGEDFLDFHFWV